MLMMEVILAGKVGRGDLVISNHHQPIRARWRSRALLMLAAIYSYRYVAVEQYMETCMHSKPPDAKLSCVSVLGV